MMRAFLPNVPSGTWERIIEYANNEPVVVGLEIFLSYRDWCEIQEQPFYRELIQYLDTLKIQESKSYQREELSSVETEACDIGYPQEDVSFFEAIRNGRKRRRRQGICKRYITD